MTDASSVGRGLSWRGTFAKLRSLLEFGQFATLFTERPLDPVKSVRYDTALGLTAAHLPENVSISHTPGVLTVGAAYGVRQILDFSGSRAGRRLIRLPTLISMAVGGLLDTKTA